MMKLKILFIVICFFFKFSDFPIFSQDMKFNQSSTSYEINKPDVSGPSKIQTNNIQLAKNVGDQNSVDWENVITVDDLGNVYVAGLSKSIIYTEKTYEIVTVKYDADGNEKWNTRYSGNKVNALAIDKVGNVYVGGSESSFDTYHDYVTIKYDSSGIQEWVALYNGSGNHADIVNALTVDDSGYVYVTGSSYGTRYGMSTGNDFITIKYNSKGEEQWINRYDNNGASDERPFDIATDEISRSVYVMGQGYHAETGPDLVIINYDFNGSQKWKTCYSGYGDSIRFDDYYSASFIDDSNNIYIVGTSGSFFVTVKLNFKGEILWSTKFEDFRVIYPVDITVDWRGNVYVTGRYKTLPGSGIEVITIGYDSSGVELWHNRYSGVGYTYNDPVEIVTDFLGNIYVAGNGWSQNQSIDWFIIQYDIDGNYQGSIYPSGSGVHDVHDMAIDILGNLYVLGNMTFGIGQPVPVYWTNKDINPDQSEIEKGDNTIINKNWYLFQNYPNPFNPATKIEYEVKEYCKVNLIIYNINGQIIKELVNSYHQPSTYSINVNMQEIPSGIYFYKIQMDDFKAVKKMLKIE